MYTQTLHWKPLLWSTCAGTCGIIKASFYPECTNYTDSRHSWSPSAADLSCTSGCFFFLRFYLFIYSWETQRERERERERENERQRHRQREKLAPCREPNVGLDPGPPGSCPGLKVVLNRWATWAAQPQTIGRCCEHFAGSSLSLYVELYLIINRWG